MVFFFVVSKLCSVKYITRKGLIFLSWQNASWNTYWAKIFDRILVQREDRGVKCHFLVPFGGDHEKSVSTKGGDDGEDLAESP